MLCSQNYNYHTQWLVDLCHKPGGYTKRQLNYHLSELAKEVDRAREVIAEKKAAA